MHASPKALFCAALFVAAGCGDLRADDGLRKAQQALREQGFYYGTVDGAPGDETTQAIRRYQIRNGLAVTGELNAETQQSIAKTSPSAAPRTRTAPAPEPTVPPPLERQRPAPPVIDGNDDDAAPAPPRPPASRPDLRVEPPTVRGPASGGFRPSAALTNLLADTPFEFAPPPVQSDVVRRAQISLLRSGFYGGEPDGVAGEATGDALAEFQSANRLRRTGRLDVATLAALRLLPGRRERPPVFQGRIVR